MHKPTFPEVWLRGPLPQVPALLQPVAHALLQAKEEVNSLLSDFPNNLLWKEPAGVASVAFHLQHLTGVLHRLFTYAEGKQLTAQDLDYLKAEGVPTEKPITVQELVQAFAHQVDLSLQKLIETDPSTLTDIRAVGRAKLPSTVMGLLFHAAEHTMRHVGQLLVTARILLSEIKTG